jgi:tetratricopeptide (TPR) repeat protein
MMMQSQMTPCADQNIDNTPHRRVGVRVAQSIQPPPCGGGYGVLRDATFVSIALILTLLFALPSNAQPELDTTVELSPLVKRLLDDDLLSEAQRREAMIFHGQWDELGELNAFEQLRLANLQHDANAYPERYDDRALQERVAKWKAIDPDADASRLLYAFTDMHLDAGHAEQIIRMHRRFDAAPASPAWQLLFAKASEDTGRYPRAIQHLTPIRERVQADPDAYKTAEDMTAAARAIVMLARLEGRPAADFHLANQLLSKAHEEADPLYWPAYVAEAELLMSKGNPRQAMDAINQALSLNPKSSEAWYQFGTMRSRFFDFASASKAVEELRAINDEHPLADALAVQIALRQKDMQTAQEVIAAGLERYPTHRKLLALNAAVEAQTYDEAGKADALKAFAELAPGNPLAEHAVGQALSDARQYALAEPHLKRAIAMLPGWSEPQLTLGELYMQWGKLQEAATQLETASKLDPFHKEITNQLLLAKEMLGYETIETDQFVVRYLPGIDEVLARDVALHMGTMVEAFIKRFDHDPPALTQVDLMPDDQHFAVRVTGLPEIWTIAACTGDVIAMTPPRPGPKRAYGTYNWLNVMGHEYVHVVNLSQTTNRVPHWFTEGCAVNMETTGRLWSQYALLARCYNTNDLFDYDEINWGFIRPTQPHHRSLAYAQSAWIIQYIEQEHGWDKVLQMIELYHQGVGEHETIKRVFGVDVESFMKSFMGWAGEQVQAWGMSSFGVEPEDETLKRILSAEDASAIDPAKLDAAMKAHPGEPGLLRVKAELTLKGDDADASLEALKAYQAARPVDPWADRELARLALQTGASQTAVESLLTLDKIEGDAPEYAVELSRVYRARKDYDAALRFAERALLREPYNATYRESAATIAVQKGDFERAAFHVESLELLEPQRSIHPKRLAVIYKRLGRDKASAAAQQRAEALELLNDKTRP